VVDVDGGDPGHPQQPGFTGWDGALCLAAGFCEAVVRSQNTQSAPEVPHRQFPIGLDVPLPADAARRRAFRVPAAAVDGRPARGERKQRHAGLQRQDPAGLHR